jgi:hypothetical protein
MFDGPNKNLKFVFAFLLTLVLLLAGVQVISFVPYGSSNSEKVYESILMDNWESIRKELNNTGPSKAKFDPVKETTDSSDDWDVTNQLLLYATNQLLRN